jgi:hypothetical protein
MKYEMTQRINPAIFKDSGVSEEFLFRELAQRLVREIPIVDLKALIKFTVIDQNKAAKIVRDKGPSAQLAQSVLREELTIIRAEVNIENR